MMISFPRILALGTAMFVGAVTGVTAAPPTDSPDTSPAARMVDPAATITADKDTWTLANAAMAMKLTFIDGSLRVTGLTNLAAGRDYLAGRANLPVFTHTVAGVDCPADDGKWMLAGAQVTPIDLFGKSWGKKLEITMSRTQTVAFTVRQVFEIYDGGALRILSHVKNGTDKPLAIGASDILALNLPDDPHKIHYVTGNVMWNVGDAGVHRNGRIAVANYNTGDGWFIVPENNWATCLVAGASKATAREKLLYLTWDVTGPATITARKNAGFNATVSGVFVDEP